MRRQLQIFLLLLVIQLKAYGDCRYCYFWKSHPDELTSRFYSCIDDLPEPITCLGPCDRRGRDGFYSRDGLAKQAKTYYLCHLFPSYSVGGIIHLFNQLRLDLNEEYLVTIDSEERWINGFLAGKRHCYAPDNQDCMRYAYKKIAQTKQAMKDAIPMINDCEDFFFEKLAQDIAYCLKGRSHWEEDRRVSKAQLFYDKGFLNFRAGKFEESIEDALSHINYLKDGSGIEQLTESHLLFQGKAFSQVLAYDDAINALSMAIELNPDNKEAYFDRAVAYFETAQFNSSFSDYLQSGTRLNTIESMPDSEELSRNIEYATGLLGAGVIYGGLEGAIEGSIDFIPSFFRSATGLANGLFALISNPKQVSLEFISSCQNCIQTLKENPELLKELVPELKELINRYDKLTEFQKGELMGKAIGKYTVDIFAMSGSIKLIKAYQNLKKANNALTLDVLSQASPQEIDKTLSLAKKWNEKHRAAIENFKIKHLEKEISDWLGAETKMIINPKGDPIFLSKDGKRKVRFDFNWTAPHENPHLHIEHLLNDEWQEISRIYPIDVPHK